MHPRVLGCHPEQPRKSEGRGWVEGEGLQPAFLFSEAPGRSRMVWRLKPSQAKRASRS